MAGNPIHGDRASCRQDSAWRPIGSQTQQMEPLHATTAQRPTGSSPSAVCTTSEGGARTSVKLLYGLFGAVLLAYWISLMARRTGDTTTWLDGWGAAGFELLMSALVLLRAALKPQDRRYALLLGIGGC